MIKKLLFLSLLFSKTLSATPQQSAVTPPMGWMSWNYFADQFNEQDIRDIANSMESTGMVKAGYRFIMIDDGWQGGRDNRNNIIPDPKKFPSGIKALAAYLHHKGIKLGIYSDAAALTCAGYTASFNFEKQDAATFASWDIDYLKYDYCNAPTDSATAKIRYAAMAVALKNCGRKIVFSICEWGDRQPWKWAAQAGGNLWRTTADIRDKWAKKDNEKWGNGIIDNFDINAGLNNYEGPGHWNDPDMLIIGLYGKKGPSGDGGGTGCSDIAYQSQMSLWSIMAAPLIASNDIRDMNEQTKRILLNPEVIAIDQDSLGKQAEIKLKNSIWEILLKPLQSGYAIAILNRSGSSQHCKLPFSEIGLSGRFKLRDVWAHADIGNAKAWSGTLRSHETVLIRLKPN